ncbi:cysteine hydrolase [Celeribacter sp. HF31]|uniref:cysteine hydrolase family protein n=1 Tax=Celeribacter sp. HF31 TaxID=2721558 RepID=UPI001430A40B|nr:cysteine hydrolase family protein [Celeribacter sp. HF31]NIY79018.1 cysteine hydrolase [Celeribacter sp. HF31]
MTTSALILIDIQNDYFPNFPDSKMPLPAMDAASQQAASLLAAARDTGMTVVHIQHVMPTKDAPFFIPDTPGAEIHASVAPLASETVVTKARPSSFVGTGLDALLRDAGVEQLIVCGAMSQMCVDATVRAAVDLGYKVTVAHDACAAASVSHGGVDVPSEMVHAAIMAPLAASYAKVDPTAEILARLKS